MHANCDRSDHYRFALYCETERVLDSYGSEQKVTVKSMVSEPGNSGERN
ncbi:MAG: hypothetical protein ACUVTP_08705 [Candidatus Fervidibacter sp.]